MTKKLPLWDIKVSSDDCIFTPGRRSPEDFVQHCREHDDGYLVDPQHVAYCHARWIPVWENGEFVGHYLDHPVEPKRGAFLITYADQYVEIE